MTPRKPHRAQKLELVAKTVMPTEHADQPFHAYAYRSEKGGITQMALKSPGTTEGPVLVRVHSECLTGDAFGSLRCDCGPQLQESLRRIAASPGGIVIYLRGQEGRGIGLGNKMRAYALQDQGMDTAEANHALGLPGDARDYTIAAQILRDLGHDDIRLLTNNPDKAGALTALGINVVAIEPLIIPANPHNRRYLETKASKFGHAIPKS
jgi:3,4-dihydroxy 2-butanone 4-phosphate synthase/GTP cyclohydrolase II